MRTEGICSAPLRSRDIRDKVRNGILALFRDQLYFSATKQRRTKSFGTHVHNTSNNTSTKLQLQQIKLHIDIVNSKPVTPTTILLRRGGAAGGELQGQLWRQLGWRTGASVAAVKVAGGLAVEAARVATGGVVVKTAEEASVQAATWAAFEAAGGTFVDAATVKAVEGAGRGTVEAATQLQVRE